MKKRRRKDSDEPHMAAEGPFSPSGQLVAPWNPKLRKYYAQRFDYFSKYDEGCAPVVCVCLRLLSRWIDSEFSCLQGVSWTLKVGIA